MSELAKERPQEYPKGTPPLSSDEVQALVAKVPGWEVVEGGKAIGRDFSFKDFNEAFGFLTRVALLAEAESHHPDISNSWNRVGLKFFTHTADGLTRNDFIMAAKIDRFAP